MNWIADAHIFANALYKNKKYKESLEYAEKLGKEITASANCTMKNICFFTYNAE